MDYLGLPINGTEKKIIKSPNSDQKNSADLLFEFGEMAAANFKSFVLKNQRVAESLDIDYMDNFFNGNPLDKIYMDAYISHLAKSEHIHAHTTFELSNFVSIMNELSNGASPFNKVEWESIKGKKHADELERLFDEEKFAVLHSTRMPKIVTGRELQ